MSVALRNPLVVNVSGLSVEDDLIRPLQNDVHLCMAPMLLLTGLTFTGRFQSCILSNAARNDQSGRIVLLIFLT